MKNFGKQTYCPLDIIKPYQRKKLSHRRIKPFDREAELTAATAVGSGDFHEKAVKGEFRFTLFFYAE
jgi:hypothetical protein